MKAVLLHCPKGRGYVLQVESYESLQFPASRLECSSLLYGKTETVVGYAEGLIKCGWGVKTMYCTTATTDDMVTPFECVWWDYSESVYDMPAEAQEESKVSGGVVFCDEYNINQDEVAEEKKPEEFFGKLDCIRMARYSCASFSLVEAKEFVEAFFVSAGGINALPVERKMIVKFSHALYMYKEKQVKIEDGRLVQIKYLTLEDL